MPIYDNENFQRSLVPSYLKAEIREIIETAVMFGWKMHVSSAHSVTLVSYDERKKFHFSRTNRASKSLNQIKRDIIKFGEPEKLLMADSILGMKDRELAQMATTLLPALGDEGTVVDHRPALEKEAEEKKEAALEYARDLTKKRPVSTGNSEPTAAAAVAEGEVARAAESPYILTEKPMMAKARDGQAYASRVAIERHWSDGTVDYKCVDCDFTSKDRLSIRGHRTRKDHQKRGIERAKVVQGDVPLAASYKPRKDRVEALAQAIADAMAAGATDPESIALEALMWVHEQSKKGTRYAAEFEPMSAEETLERIRSLIAGEAQFEALTEKDQQIEVLQSQAETYKTEMEKLTERVEELESFIELANTLRRRDSA